MTKPLNRRILHQPLVPIQWTPPSPPPPSPPSLFSPIPFSATTTTTISSISSPTHYHNSTTTTIAIIVASIIIGFLFLLSLLFLFYQHHRGVQNTATKTKKEVEPSASSTFLALAKDDNSDEVGSSDLRFLSEEMLQLELNHPSPEIKPLPPLLTGLVTHEWSLSHPSPELKPLAPLPRKQPENMSVSDEDVQHIAPKRSLERSYSWSGTTRFSIGSSPDISQQLTSSVAQPIELHGNGEDYFVSNEPGLSSLEKPVRTAWGRFKSRSLRLDDDMIEINASSFRKERIWRRNGAASKRKPEKRILNAEKAESIEILLRTSAVKTEDVREALLTGGSEFLGTEFLDSLVKLAPTKEEEFVLQRYRGEVTRLNAAERFLKEVLAVPFAMKRIDVMLYRARFDANINYLRTSFQTLQDACQDLRRSKIFLKLLEAAMDTRNQLINDYYQENVNLYRLSSLLKLCDAKGEGGTVTPLHLTIEDLISNQNTHSDIIREEEYKKRGLKSITGLSAELENVKKAAEMDFHLIKDHVNKEDLGLEKVRWLLQLDKACHVGESFFKRMKKFANEAEMEIESVKDQAEMTSKCIRETTEYFNLAMEEANPLRIFILVRDFLFVLEDVCKDIGRMQDRAMIGSLSGRFSRISPIPSAVT